MSKSLKRNLIIVVCVIAVIIVVGMILSPSTKEFKPSHTVYDCDVKSLHLNTDIEIKKDGEDFVTVSGDVFRIVEDPLTMYDSDGNKTAYAGDAYHFIAQDSHTIYVDGEFTVELVGLVDFWGQSYEIYDQDENKIGEATFNASNTAGNMYDTEGKLIADYTSEFLFNDFKVRISEECELDEKTVLMIFCSYYSDQHADNSN